MADQHEQPGSPYAHLGPEQNVGEHPNEQQLIAGAEDADAEDDNLEELFRELPVHLTNPGCVVTDALPRVSSLHPSFNGKTIPPFVSTALYIPTSDRAYHRAKYDFMFQKVRLWSIVSSQLNREMAGPDFTLQLLRQSMQALEDIHRNVRDVPGHITRRQDDEEIIIEVLEVKVRVNNFISWLGGLDFHPLGGGITAFAHSVYPDSMVNFSDYPLFALEGTVYVLRLLKHPLCKKITTLSRRDRDLEDHEKSDLEWLKRPELADILMHVKHLLRADSPYTPPCLVVDLGVLYTHMALTAHGPVQAIPTKFHVLMEVGRWEKPLWLAYEYEYHDLHGVMQWRDFDQEGHALLPGVRPFDLAVLTHNLDSFGNYGGGEANNTGFKFQALHLDGAEVRRVAAESGSVARPIFAEPDYDTAIESLLYAWSPPAQWPENLRQWGNQAAGAGEASPPPA